MRMKGSTVQQVVLGLALLAALCWNLAHANEIKSLQVNEGATGTRAELTLQTGVAYRTLRLSAPERFVIDLPDTAAGHLKLPAAVGVVKAVRSGQPAPGTTRIVFDLNTAVVPLQPRMETGADGVRLIVEWPGDGPAKPAVATRSPSTATPRASGGKPSGEKPAADKPAGEKPVAAAPSANAPANPASNAPSVASTSTSASASTGASTNPAAILNAASVASAASSAEPAIAMPQTPAATAPATATRPLDPPATAKPVATNEPATAPLPPLRLPQDLRSGARPLIVAIDAGHGGQDPGAHGPTGKREKDVTLAIARELARQVNATPGLKAYLTRDTDVFLPLPRRTQLARQAKADIFVSIHADAAENRAARGSSVFVLSLRGASSQRARWLADKENAADLIGVRSRVRANDNTLASVLLDLTQSGQMKASEDAAGYVLSGLKSVGNSHKDEIERANFAVLRTSDNMPAMLVETAFISNPDEEDRLTDPSYQRQLARAVLGGIDTYFSRQPPPGTLYAARARAQDATVVASATNGASNGVKSVSSGGSPE